MGKASSKHDLSPEEFDELVASTHLTSAEIDDWYRKFRHEFPSGRVGRREFKGVYERLFPHGDADRFCGHVFRVYDADGDGVVSFVELLTTMHVFSDGRPEDKLRAMFRMYDIDCNGYVTVDEIARIFASIYSTSPGDLGYQDKARMDAASIMCQLDANNDRKLSMDEFVRAATTFPAVVDRLKLKGVK